MIDKSNFLKDPQTIRLISQFKISRKAITAFYDGFESMRDIVKKRSFNWDYLSEYDWTKILEIEENLQWSILKYLGNPSLDIYKDIDPKKKIDAISFRDSINREIELRERKPSISEGEYTNTLKILINQRFEFLLTIFEIDKKTGWWKVMAGVAVVGGGIVGGKIIYNKFTRHKKDPT